MKFRELLEGKDIKISNADNLVKKLLKIPTVTSAKVNNDKTIDIKTKGNIKAWENDGTGAAIDKLGLFMYHAYNGLSGNSWELRNKNNG